MVMNMKSWYDDEEDILGIEFKGRYWKSIELPSGILIDIDRKGNVVGIEIWNASRVFKGENKKVIQMALALSR